jgi:lysophospholipase L1-like esterase
MSVNKDKQYPFIACVKKEKLNMHKMAKLSGLVLILMLMMCACAKKTPNELVIACVGDSIMRPIPSHLEELMSDVTREVVFIDWSRGGKTVRKYLNFYKRRFRDRSTVRPDFIIIQLGTNDIQSLISGEYSLDKFVVDMTKIINEFKTYSNAEESSSHVLIANVPFLYKKEFEQLNRYIKEMLNPTIETVARDEGVYLVDNNRILSNKPHLYHPDGVHPNPTGENVLAQNWLIAIRRVSRFSTSNSF